LQAATAPSFVTALPHAVGKTHLPMNGEEPYLAARIHSAAFSGFFQPLRRLRRHLPMNGEEPYSAARIHSRPSRVSFSPSVGCPIPAASGGTSPLRGEDAPPHEWGGAFA